jgi:serine/threonine-protein kinase
VDRRVQFAEGMMHTATSGQQIERYTIDRKLTEGGMAEVYLAHRSVAGFDQPVVLKSLLPGFLDNRELVAMMCNEARLATRLSHPNIVRVEDLVEVGGRPFIVMEYLDGQNLRQIMHRALQRQRTLSLAFVCRVVAKTLEALEHAHDVCNSDGRPLGLVHRDVSLDNVIVTSSGRVALIDFGIAKPTTLLGEELTRAGQVKGKCAYMSPEQVRSEPLDRRSDLFSVGIILWEMLTQRRLFARRSELDSMVAIVCKDAVPPRSIAPELPEALDVICGMALARDREQRYQTAGELRRELEAVIATEGWRASPNDLRDELAAIFPVEIGKAEPSMYDEDERPTRLSPRHDFVADVPDAASPARVATATLRAADSDLYNQRPPGPSVYDDWPSPRQRRRWLWLWLATLFVAGFSMLVAFLAARAVR